MDFWRCRSLARTAGAARGEIGAPEGAAQDGEGVVSTWAPAVTMRALAATIRVPAVTMGARARVRARQVACAYQATVSGGRARAARWARLAAPPSRSCHRAPA